MNKKQRIRELREQGWSYQKISDELGVDRSYAWRVCNGKEDGKPRQRIEDVPGLTEEELATKFGSIETGAITEALVAVKLTLMGFDVWVPFIERRRSDLGVFVAGRLVRIQAKTAGYESRNKRFRATISTKSAKGERVRYSPQDIDFFIVKCSGIEEYYVIPAIEGVRVGTVNLYPNRERLLEKGDGFEKYRNAFGLLKGSL